MNDTPFEPIAFVLIGLVVATIAHEAGHAICGAVAGVPIRLFSIGRGPIVARFRLSHMHLVLRAIPIFGIVYPYPPLVVAKGRLLLLYAGGALGNLAVLALIAGLGAAGALSERAGYDAGFIAIAQACVALGNLIPFRRGEQPSDGLTILRLLRLTAGAQTAAGQRYAARRARYAEAKPSPARQRAMSSVLAYSLERRDLYTSLAEQRDFRKAAQRALAGALAPDEEMLILDALVSMGATHRDPDFLASLDEWSARALRLDAANPTLRGSRGAALLALGRHAEGMALLASIDATAAPRDFAIAQVFLAEAHWALGEKEAAGRSLAAARSVDAEAIAPEPWATMVRTMEAALSAPWKAEALAMSRARPATSSGVVMVARRQSARRRRLDAAD
jgi:hypothetical protein